MGNINSRNILAAFLLFVTSLAVSAQTLEMQQIPNTKTQVGLNFKKAFYSSTTNMSTLSGAFNLKINVPVSQGMNIIGRIPFLNMSYDIKNEFINYSYSENGVGNIFVGLQIKPKIIGNNKSTVTVGLYLPTAKEEVAMNGYWIDYYHYMDYLPNTVCVNFNYAYHRYDTGRFLYGFELGPDILIPTEGKNRDMEVFAHYGVMGGIQVNRLQVSFEFTGIAVITEEIKNFDDRFFNMLTGGVQYHGSVVSPKVFYRIYLRDEMNDFIDGVLGLGVNVAID